MLDSNDVLYFATSDLGARWREKYTDDNRPADRLHQQQTTGSMYDLEPSYLICLTKFDIPQYKEMKHTFALKDDNGARYGERDLLKLLSSSTKRNR